ncbi:hypothetical protein [Embleya sp. NPDC059237]|uniref:hypothetical protein n=1 Tax=Embleya sp. NPDC059237 TaxID=3346784 RepID=UPI0036C81C9F
MTDELSPDVFHMADETGCGLTINPIDEAGERGVAIFACEDGVYVRPARAAKVIAAIRRGCGLDAPSGHAMSEPMSDERLAEVRAVLESVPAGPWWWRLDCGSPDLMTQHSGWLYLLESEATVREDGEPQTDIVVRTEFPGAKPPQAPLMRSSRELGAAFKSNPVVRFTEQSPTLVAELLAEVDRLRSALEAERASRTSGTVVGTCDGCERDGRPLAPGAWMCVDSASCTATGAGTA